ncbi:hypothetical protein [Kitasatospora sp. NPDC059571]|uniref:hypothetical protein n=1 Tax=Kitasatospora sp. NPDC059571 TaxID=3346871 RepID=UPI0036A30DD3
MAEFDAKNHWLIDHGDGRPSVNLPVLSFVHPLKLLNGTTNATTLDGVPRGMAWDQALAQNATLLGQRAAAPAGHLGVGSEIDYEQTTGRNLTGLQAFASDTILSGWTACERPSASPGWTDAPIVRPSSLPNSPRILHSTIPSVNGRQWS